MPYSETPGNLTGASCGLGRHLCRMFRKPLQYFSYVLRYFRAGYMSIDTYIRTYIHTYIHTYMHTCRLTDIQTYRHIDIPDVSDVSDVSDIHIQIGP